MIRKQILYKLENNLFQLLLLFFYFYLLSQFVDYSSCRCIPRLWKVMPISYIFNTSLFVTNNFEILTKIEILTFVGNWK